MRPPISPRRAFLYSLFVPGLGQAKLDRGHAGAIFVAFEGVALSMARKSAYDLRQARQFRQDSILVRYNPDGTGVYEPSPFNEGLIKSRQSQYEDWVALVIFNHFFAGADAFVAAHLWDLPGRISMRVRPDGAAVSARVAW